MSGPVKTAGVDVRFMLDIYHIVCGWKRVYAWHLRWFYIGADRLPHSCDRGVVFSMN